MPMENIVESPVAVEGEDRSSNGVVIAHPGADPATASHTPSAASTAFIKCLQPVELSPTDWAMNDDRVVIHVG